MAELCNKMARVHYGKSEQYNSDALECPPDAICTLYPCVWSAIDIYWTVPKLETAAACLHHCPDLKARQQQLPIFNESGMKAC